MTNLVPFAQVGGEMPSVALGNGESVSALEFFRAIAAQAPAALQHESWLRLAKMAFIENRMDCLQLAKQQAVEIQRGQGMGEFTGMSMPMSMPMPMPQQYPTTYYHPQPQPIVFSPQITVNPTITPTFQVTANPNNSNTHRSAQASHPHSYCDLTDNIAIWLGLLFATAALVLLILG